MLRWLLVVLLLIVCVGLRAQSRADSAMKAMARRDASKFKIAKQDLEKFHSARTDSLSDIFKPGKKHVKDTTLLADSVYTSAFRNAAYHKTYYRYVIDRHGLGYLGAMIAALIAIAALAGVSMLVRKVF